MRLVYVPWMLLLLVGIVYAFLSAGTVQLVLGVVMAVCGAGGWADTVRRHRSVQEDSKSDQR